MAIVASLLLSHFFNHIKSILLSHVFRNPTNCLLFTRSPSRRLFSAGANDSLQASCHVPEPGGLSRVLSRGAQSGWATVLEGTCLYLRTPVAPLKGHLPRHALPCPASGQLKTELPQHCHWHLVQSSVPAPGRALSAPRDGKGPRSQASRSFRFHD